MSEIETAGATEEGGPDTSDSRLAPLLVGLGMIAIGLVMLGQIFAIPADGFGMQGPRFFPLVVVGGWLLLSVIYVIQHVIGIRRDGIGLPAERFAHTGQLLLLVVALVVYALVLDTVGYWIATSVLFVVSARAMGSRQPVRDLIIGVLLSLVVYIAFTRLLGVRLPEGVLGL